MSIHLDHQSLGTQGLARPLTAVPAAPTPIRPSFKRKAWTAVKTSTVVGVGLVVGAIAAERLAPIEWRPSTFIGAFAGREEAARILTAIEAKRAEVAMQQEEAARAQQEVIVIQANNERVTRAYDALFQRGNLLAQQWADGAKHILMLDTQNKLRALEGRAEVSATKDKVAMWCDLAGLLVPNVTCGDDLRRSAYNDRSAMSAEIIANYKRQSALIASSLQDWAQGLPDPAQVVAYKHKIEQLHPTPRAPIPPAPLPPGSSAS